MKPLVKVLLASAALAFAFLAGAAAAVLVRKSGKCRDTRCFFCCDTSDLKNADKEQPPKE